MSLKILDKTFIACKENGDIFYFWTRTIIEELNCLLRSDSLILVERIYAESSSGTIAFRNIEVSKGYNSSLLRLTTKNVVRSTLICKSCTTQGMLNCVNILLHKIKSLLFILM